MEYVPKSAVWEITMGCNMRCGHCGSSCAEPLPGELTTEEALKLCDDLAEIGLEKITLSGGEPFTRGDWHQIAKRLIDNGIVVTIISNGWLIDENIVNLAKESGVNSICISLDGLEKTHDSIRKKGSFKRVMSALDLMRKMDFKYSVNTTVMGKNYRELPKMKKLLIDKKIWVWQFQLVSPMGNMASKKDQLFDPLKMNELISFLHETMNEGKIPQIVPTDNIGYHVKKNYDFTRKDKACYLGCQAGKRIIGILHDGTIIGCASLRDRKYIAGNIRENSIREIWNGTGFDWNRCLKKTDLQGFCRECQFAESCFGGCSSMKYFTENNFLGNEYCAYKQLFDEFRSIISQLDVPFRLKRLAGTCVDDKSFNMAKICLDKLLKINGDDIETLSLLGFVLYELGNYEASLEINNKGLKLAADNWYLLKGAGLCLVKLGREEEGIALLKESIRNASADLTDPYYDFVVTLYNLKHFNEALKVLENIKYKIKDFDKVFGDLDRKIKQECNVLHKKQDN